MATLKGSNLRILEQTGSSNIKVIGMARSCTITLNGNAEDLRTKDDIGNSQRPIITSMGWSIQVESLEITNITDLLTIIKNGGIFNLRWDETALADNQTAQNVTFGRRGTAILNDLSLTFNNREVSVKNLQFTGQGAISTLNDTMSTDVQPIGTYTRGEMVRLFLSSDNSAAPTAVIAAARQLTLHISATLEDATTKDTVGNYVVQEVTGISYDISTTALVRSGESISSQVPGKDLAAIEEIYEAGNPVKWKIANVSGNNNRTAGSIICSGSAVITNLQINASVGTAADYTAQLQGYGPYAVSA